jgi:F-type H+-transporting ATPase subunit b
LLVLDWNIIWTIVNILVLFLFFKKFLFKPVTQMMEKRTRVIEDSLQDAENKKQEALKLKFDYQEELNQAGIKASEILKEARERAAVEYVQQVKEAKDEAARIMMEANKVIELEKQKSMQDAQAEIANIAMLAASKIIRKNVDDSTNKEFLGDFLKEVGAAK